MNQKTKKALNIASYVLIGLIAVMALMVIMLNATSSSTEPPKLFGTSVFIVESNSMKRTYTGFSEDGIENKVTFSKGDLVFIKRLTKAEDKKNLKIGDVILYLDKEQERFNTHKIVGVTESSGVVRYTTRGVGLKSDGKTQIPQNAEGNDQLAVSYSDVIGVYKGKLSGVGAVFKFFQSFVGFGLLIVLPMFAFLGYRIYIVVKLMLAINKEKKQGTTLSDMEKMQAEIEKLKAELQADKAQSTGPEESP